MDIVLSKVYQFSVLHKDNLRRLSTSASCQDEWLDSSRGWVEVASTYCSGLVPKLKTLLCQPGCEAAETMGLLAEVKTWWISHLLLFYIVLMSGLVVNFLMLLTFVFVWPFNKDLYRKIVIHLGYSWWSRKYKLFCTLCLCQISCFVHFPLD